MPARKTREELDAEMGPAPAAVESGEPGGLDSPEAEAATVEEEPRPKDGPAAATLRLKSLLESLLFSAEGPVPLQALLGVARDLNSGLGPRDLQQALEELRVELREQGRGVRVAEVAGGYQLRTPTEAAPYVKRLVARRPPRLTRATLETLAIVAYRQPVTRGELEEIRGVDSGAVLKHLLNKRLVKILGRKEEAGRPLLYGTTSDFLAFFSLKDLGSMPTLRDFAELSDEHRASLGLSLGPTPEGAAQAEQLPGEDFLKVEETDAYAPVGEDEVMQELTATLMELKQRHRLLEGLLPGEQKPPERQAASPAEGPAAAAPSPGEEEAPKGSENKEGHGGGAAGGISGGPNCCGGVGE